MAPRIAGLHLFDHRLVRVVPGQECRDRRERRDEGGTEGDVEHPTLAGVVGVMVDVFLGSLEGDFDFFHGFFRLTDQWGKYTWWLKRPRCYAAALPTLVPDRIHFRIAPVCPSQLL